MIRNEKEYQEAVQRIQEEEKRFVEHQARLEEMGLAPEGHRDRIETFKLESAGLNTDSWLCLVGVDATTRFQLRIERKAGGKPLFNLTSDDRANEWENADDTLRVRTGDGTVPYLGAEPSFLARKNLVCLRPEDFGYWEVGDRLLLKVAGFHAILANMNLAQRLVVSHFRGRPTKGLWARPAPGVSKSQWAPPVKGLEMKG